MEAKASGDAIISKLGKAATIVGFEPGTDSKEQRWETAAPTFRAGKVSFASEGCEIVDDGKLVTVLGSAWVEGCVEELATAENADNDDQVDTPITQYILDAMKAKGAPRAGLAKPTSPTPGSGNRSAAPQVRSRHR